MLKYLLILVAMLTFPGAASAACTSPSGVEGEIIYNKVHGVPQYCDGTKWWGMGWKSGGGGSATPAGAVMAFDLSTCPDGWSEYLPARGRFIRGVDSAGTLDPSGTRAVGSLQADALQNLTGTVSFRGGEANSIFGGMSGVFAASSQALSHTALPITGTSPTLGVATFDASRVARTSTETRPVNVALLYCRKN